MSSTGGGAAVCRSCAEARRTASRSQPSLGKDAVPRPLSTRGVAPLPPARVVGGSSAGAALGPQLPVRPDSRTGSPSPHTPPSAAAPPGYELLSELGRGAMGVVYRARDVRLNRIVALKMLLGGAHSSAADRARFVREAEAVARITHPNIVGLYDIGEHAGLLYLAMEFCGGGRLSDKIDGRPMPAKRAAQIVETVARAIQAAHNAGIIHRDLKPDNILLTADGVAKVADFGLAKRVDGDGPAAATATGAALGTPSYMAPEQAEGKSVGPAADVYALGAILYELVTGRPPFLGESEVHTIWMVISQEPVPVRELASRCPRDLETLIHKCLEKEPRRRLSSATDLADELLRFQQDQPIRSRPAGPLERTVKWAVRQPVAAGSLGVLLAAFVVVTVALVGVTRERRRAETLREQAEETARQLEQEKTLAEQHRQSAEKARTDAEAARTEAEDRKRAAEKSAADARAAEKVARENFELAQQSVRECLDLARSSPVFQKPGLQEARALLLAASLPYHARFQTATKGSGDDVPAMVEFVKAHFEAAGASSEVGRLDAAVKSYQEAMATLERIAKLEPNNPTLAPTMGQCLLSLAPLLAKLGRVDEAMRAHQRATALYSTLLARYPQQSPEAATFHADLGGVCFNRGNLYSQLSRRVEALDSYRLAVSHIESALAINPTNRVFNYRLSMARFNLGVSLTRAGQPDEGLPLARRGVELMEELVVVAPNSVDFQEELARQCSEFGSLQHDRRQHAEAEKLLTTAKKVQAKLYNASPSVTQNAVALMATCNNLGNVLVDLDRLPDAELEYKTCLELVARMVGSGSDTLVTLIASKVHYNYGKLLVKVGRLAEADRMITSATTLAERLVRDHGTKSGYAEHLEACRVLRATWQRARGEPAQGKPAQGKPAQG